MCCENFGRFHQRKLSQIKPEKGKRTHLFGNLKFKTKTGNFNRDDRKTLLNHSLLLVISLEERKNAKTAFKS